MLTIGVESGVVCDETVIDSMPSVDRNPRNEGIGDSNVTVRRKRAGMIRSVSMSSPRSGRARPLMSVIFLIRSSYASAGSLSSSRTSVTSPVSAAAATIAGLMRSVRPVGLPCRPLKFLLDEAAQT